MTLSLAEHEVGRETVLKIPVAERNVLILEQRRSTKRDPPDRGNHPARWRTDRPRELRDRTLYMPARGWCYFSWIDSM
jgi:hypothetical protein